MEEKVKEWLSRLAANEKERVELLEFVAPGGEKMETCSSSTPSVHLFKCARRIVELLGLPYNEEIIEYKGGTKAIELSFMYEDVKFFGLEDCNA